MGRGNVCVTGEAEGLFFIDNEDYYVYTRYDENSDITEAALMRDLSLEDICGEWNFDEIGTTDELEDIIDTVCDDFRKRFKSFARRKDRNMWIDSTKEVIMESGLFYIVLEDNSWSIAVELLQKEFPETYISYGNLQKRLYEKYLDCLKDCLLDRLGKIGTYTGAWTSGVIERK